MKLDGIDLTEEGNHQEGARPSWMPFQASRRTPLELLNHKTEQLTVAEREALGATAPRTSRSWAQDAAKRRRIAPDQAAVGPKEEEELPQAECSIAPWWLEE
ncbi:hypothetical protein OG592_36995 [Streptomyces avidinii]|uniref:hypothetical protein n=1 Tax=Streptomyces avidinii TaxID=1895 RepID=UPI003867450B|nr:hypothetical protein OG592_36995 [Streptomyces avidinii]